MSCCQKIQVEKSLMDRYTGLMKSKASDDICTACSLSSSLPPLIWCIDCGDEVEISEFDSKTCRCIECNKDYQLERDRKKHKEKYDRDKKNLTEP